MRFGAPGISISRYSGKPMHESNAPKTAHRIKGESLASKITPARSGKCRIFPANSDQTGERDLAALGESMRAPEERVSFNCSLSAGYIFLSQFIEHDITRSTGSDGRLSWKNLRRRAFDLKSVYGEAGNANLLRDASHPDQMIIGKTIPTGDYGIRHSLPNDLPRIVSGARPGRALIGDPRNDSHLGLAQTHLLFLKMHNRFVEIGMNYDEARRATVQHYQSMIINDFLFRILDPNVFSAVIKQPGYVCFMPESESMPLEFTCAAYRFAFSMLGETYEWNRILQTDGLAGPVKIAQLYQLSELSGNLGGRPRLPTHWVIDWRRFYDFPADGEGPEPNLARTIGDGLVSGLNPLVDKLCPQAGDTGNLASRMLQLGKKYRLVSGQTVVDILNERGMKLHKLDSRQIGTGIDRLDRDTPLWFYILRESQAQQSGKRLGEVGSWLIADTFKRLILDSVDSVLDDTGFSPHRDILNGRRTVTMSGIIEFTGEIRPLLDVD